MIFTWIKQRFEIIEYYTTMLPWYLISKRLDRKKKNWYLYLMKKTKAKIKKVIKGLNKASKLHAGQAKTLKSVIKKKK